MTTSGVRAAPAGVPHQRGTTGHDFSDGLSDSGTYGAFRLFVEPVKPAVALLKEVCEAGQHDDFTGDIDAGVITVAEGHDKSQPSGCLLEMMSHESFAALLKDDE